LVDIDASEMRTSNPEFRVNKAVVPNGEKSWYIVGYPKGKRTRAWFATKELATAEATERNLKMRKLGEVAVTLDHSLLSSATEGATLLKPYGKTVMDAVAFYLEHLKKLSAAVSGKELCDRIKAEFARRLTAGEASQRHVDSMMETLRKFETQYTEVNVAQLTVNDIKSWLAGTDLAVKTRNRHLGYVQNMYNIAKGWGLISTNPLDDVEPFHDTNGYRKIAILTPEELIKFLKALRPEFLPFFSICAFTGLRRAEVELLDWSEVKLDRDLIDLPPSKSKNRKRKLIEVSENLLAILKPFEQTQGAVLPPKPGLQIIMNEAADKANIKWPQNVLRHSFASHAVALKGLTWTAGQDDHSERVLKEDYWEAVTKEQAKKYWSIIVA
jgi:integrase